MAKIYNDFQSANLMSFAKSFARLNGQPLDKSEIWYDLAEAQAYAATDAAYVGQILSVIDTDNNNVVFYGIQDAAGTLTEVGSAPIGDNLSIEIVDGAVQLKNFGKGYYKYVPAVKDETTGEVTTPSTYEYVEEEFVAGLEPRVVLNTDGKLEIAWYEPSEETIDGVNAKVESVANTVGALEEIVNAEGGLVDQVDELQEQIGTAADDAGNEATGLYAEIERLDEEIATKANTEDVYTKEEADEAVATAISQAIANADHLTREVVNELPAVADADTNTIYMVPSGLLEDDNKYYEWILINGVFEQVGSWEVDLSAYAKASDVTNLSNTVTALTETVVENKEAVEQAIAEEQARAEAAEQANAAAIEGKADKGTTLADYGITDAYTKNEVYTKGEADQAIADKISEVNGGESAGEVLGQLNAYKKTVNMEVWGNEDGTGDSRIDTLETKVNTLEGAEPNFISSVDEVNFTVVDGQLQLNANAGRLITNEEIATLEAVAGGDFDNYIKSVNGDVFSVDDDGKLDLIAIPASLLEPVVGDMTDLINYAEGTTIVSEINNIYDILTWKEMEEEVTA